MASTRYTLPVIRHQVLGRALGALVLLTGLCGQTWGQNVSRPVVGVVLSGGAALGFSHIGVLKVIEELGIPVDVVVGTSMGAVVGGLYAAGYTAEGLERLARNTDWESIFNDAPVAAAQGYHERGTRAYRQLLLGFDRNGFWAGKGLIAGQAAVTFMEMLTLHQLSTTDFDALPRRFRAVATDITNGAQVVLDHGSIVDAMRASVSIPGLFAPFELDGHLLVDGGAVNNLPTDIARDLGVDIVIAVEASEPPTLSAVDLKNPVDILSQTSRVMVSQNVKPREKLADLIIRPNLRGISRMSFSRAPEIIQRGEEAARAAIGSLQDIAIRVAQSRGPTAPVEASGGTDSAADPIRQIIVQGGGPDDVPIVERAFAPVVGRPADPKTLQDSIAGVMDTGRYDLVRIAFQDEAGERSLVVKLSPSTGYTNQLFLGVDYHGTWSRTVTHDLDVNAGVELRNLTGRGSLLLADASVLETPKAYTEYYQPIGPLFFVDPYFLYTLDYNSYVVDPATLLALRSRALGGGVWAGIAIADRGELEGGYYFASVRGFRQDGVTRADGLVTAVRALLHYDSRHTSVFPEQGTYAAVSYDFANPMFGGTQTFQRLGADAQINIPFSELFTADLTLSAGTDFSQSPGDPNAVPLCYSFPLKSAYQFMGYENWELYGSHKAAAGIDARVKLPSLSDLFGRDTFLTANLSAGNVWHAPADILNPLSLHVGGSVGMGVRIDRNLGVQLSASYSDNGRLQVSLDVSSFHEPEFAQQ